VDELFARIGAGEDPQWYLTDRLGSVRQIVDGAGTILDEITYDSFGGILSESNPSQGDRFKFTGREFSPELGIYYYRARWYDPSTGRFISQDPIGFSAGDPNLYRYVGNAPGDATDPSGLIEWPWEKTSVVVYFNGPSYPKTPPQDSFWQEYLKTFFDAVDMVGNQPWGTVYFDKGKTIVDVKSYLERCTGRIKYIALDSHGCGAGGVKLSPMDIYTVGEYGAYKRLIAIGETNTPAFKALEAKINFLKYLAFRGTSGLKEPIKGKVMVIEFLQCSAGNPPQGNTLARELQDILGPNVEIRLYKGNVAWLFGIANGNRIESK
jgi:RHS repeat-associated protein